MKKLSGIVAATLLLAASACGKKEGKFNEASAKQASTQNLNASVTLKDSDPSDTNAGKTAAGSFYAAAFQSSTSVSPTAFLMPSLKQGAFAAGCECSGTSCNFQDCADDDGKLTTNGTLSWTDGHVLANLTATYNDSSTINIKVTIDVDLTITATSITGHANSDGEYSVSTGVPLAGAAGSYKWSSNIEYHDVTYANGSPTGGSVTFNGEYTLANSQTYTSSGTITYP